MGLCFADSLKKYQEENYAPDPENPGNENTNPENPDENQSGQNPDTETPDIVEPDIYDGLGSINEGSTWSPVSDQGYKFYDDYRCDDVSVVNWKKKIIMKPDQLNFMQESNSQYIPFQMPRYFDGFDMGKTKIQFYYVNPIGEYGIDYAVNVYTSEDRIRFAWLVSGSVTHIGGNVKFEIQAVGKNSNGDHYMWKTYPNDEINIDEALSGNSYIEPDEMWQQNFLDLVDSKVATAQAAAEEAQGYAAESEAASAKAIDEIETARSEANEFITNAKETAIEVVENIRSEAVSTVESVRTDAIASVETIRSEAIASVETAKDDVLNAAENAEAKMDELSENIATLVEDIYEAQATETINEKVAAAMSNYYTREEVDILLDNIDISEQLDEIRLEIENMDGLANFDVGYDGAIMTFYNGTSVMKEIEINSDPTEAWTEAYSAIVDEKISSAISGVQSSINDHVAESDDKYATKSTVSSLSQTVEENAAAINTNKTNLSTMTEKLLEVEEVVKNVDTAPRVTYDATYDEEFKFTLWEQEGDDESTRTAKSQFVIQGGGGAGGTSSTLKIEYVTKTPLTVTVDDHIKISYRFSGEDSSGDQVLEGNATWKVGNATVANQVISAGENTFDITEFITAAGSYKVTLSITDDAGSLVTKRWTVQVLDVRVESTFNDSFTYPISPVTFDYTPYGAISKVIHFVLDGEEIGTATTSVSGIPMAFTIPTQEHGSHLFDIYMTADMNGDGEDDIRSNHIIKDILWYDENGVAPVIGCVMQNFTAKQYDTTNIVYTVHDPSTETPTVILAVDGNIVSTQKLEVSTNTWQFKSSEIGEHILTITCGDTVKTLTANIEKLDINLEPVTAGLVFDFNPIGKSNSDADRLWTNGDISMSVSENFDWVNGGYHLDGNGDQYFCIKAGTSAVIDYKLFADDAKKNGKEFKLVFKTANVQRADATFLHCIDNTTGSNHIGVQMNVHEARIYGQANNLQLPYSENDIIEFEFNISKNTEAVPMVMGYEDGVSSRPMVYDDSFDFTQNTPQFITLGSDSCDLHIYRFKVYNTSLSARGILNNFIADARNADEMVARYNRNQIYDENQNLDPDILAEKCPWLRVYKLSAPYFTNNKSDKVPGTIIQQIYKGGDPVLDNWTCYDCQHSGQGTSSNNYGAAGRNLDFIMNKSGVDGVKPYFVMGDGSEASNITMTRTSVPVAYLNAKVNIASSNNMTNAMLANRYNQFNPYKRPFVRDEGTDTSFIKDTMEFANCVIFVRETNEDISTHREFADCQYHLYAIGNIGDSKKTDDTRLTDPDDKYECCVEIMDVELPLSDWPVDTMYNAMGYKVDEKTEEKIYIWAKDENLGILYEKIDGEYVLTQDTSVDLTKTYYVDILEHDDFSEDFTYGWRYIYEGDDDAENEEVFDFCKQKWIELYRFVTTSSDDEFKAHLGDYFVLDSALYYYLFTTRYCMADNRAKNTFWHYGKTGEVDSDGNPIRKWDLTWGYDMDTSLGLNNYGMQVYRHGLEDIDVDEKGEEIFRESDSTFFCRVRDLFPSELKSMYNTLESKNTWHAESFINQADAWQSEFPEELWRLDIDRKYIRTYNGSFINGKADHQFLNNMCNGRMKYHRRQWERAQEKYMASKYQSSVASSDNAVLRCAVPDGDLVIAPNYRLKLTPFDYMYLNVKYGTQSPIQLRARPGVEYEIPFEGSSADIIDIYSSSLIQSFGDLSSCYPTTVDTSKASKIKELIIGNNAEGYDNPGLTSLTMGANDLLEVLNIENVSGLTQTLEMSALQNLRELYAHGSNIGGVTIAPGGKIEIAELPAISSITMRNLLYLANLDITSLEKLTRIVVENCSTVDLLTIINGSPNLNRLRAMGIDWDIEDTSILKRLYSMSGIDKNGYNTDKSVVGGRVRVPVIREQELYEYKNAWPDLEIVFDSMIEQYSVTFQNDDGSILEVQYVDKGMSAIDPATRQDNPIIPTKESTISHDFTFASWDSSLDSIFAHRVITATYTATLRTYTVRYVSKGITMQESTGLYGDNAPYNGPDPTYTAEESAYVYHLFDRWDKSSVIDGDKTIEALYDRFAYNTGAFDGKNLSDLRPVEIYALSKLGLAETVITDKDEYSITIGGDVDYDDIESEVIIAEKTRFDGKTYMDTGIKLFHNDEDFTLAIDYEFLDGNSINAVLAQCFQSNGSNGFKLWYSTGSSYTGSKFTWGTSAENIVSANKREILVIRHMKGANNLMLYRANVAGDNQLVIELERTRTTSGDATLVFGCSRADDGMYENYAIGNIHWCKLWHADLGDDVCRSLSMWPHEKITLEACGFRKYYLSENPSKRCAFSMLANNLLSYEMPWGASNSNIGGWAESTLNKTLNSRLYNALPRQIRAIIKQVEIPSSIGGKSTEVTTSDCYIAIPSVIEVDPTMTNEPYINEGTPISYLSTNSSRMRINDRGEYARYFLRSPNVTSDSYVYRVNPDGSMYGFVIPYYTAGILVEISF